MGVNTSALLMKRSSLSRSMQLQHTIIAGRLQLKGRQ